MNKKSSYNKIIKYEKKYFYIYIFDFEITSIYANNRLCRYNIYNYDLILFCPKYYVNINFVNIIFKEHIIIYLFIFIMYHSFYIKDHIIVINIIVI